MAATAFVRARIDEKLRDDAAAVLADMGLTVSDVVRITLTLVARDGALPFDLKVPNGTTRAAMTEARAKMRAGQAQFATAGELLDAIEQKAGKQ